MNNFSSIGANIEIVDLQSAVYIITVYLLFSSLIALAMLDQIYDQINSHEV